MVLDGFGSSIGLVRIIGSSLVVSYFVLCGAITLVLCGTITVIMYETHHPLWLGFGLSSGDILGQGCEATIWVMWFAWQPPIPPPLMN
jgi:hypothetical protein